MGGIIEVSGLGKRFRRGAYRPSHATLRETLTEGLRARLKLSTVRKPSRGEWVWALREVNFDVGQGEVVGIVGRNGAGKSTLLKIISRITDPTTGSVKLYGRVGNLLEVGTGFHHELTGRENIFLSGAILGMSRAEVTRKFDDIVAFSEIESFIDTPVKHYSSGMYVRLAFSVTIHLDPEILIMDEVLAVGDVAFQQKCLDKLREVWARGRTILFVSHNMSAVTRLCQRAILLSEGTVVRDGPADEVVGAYLRSELRASAESSGS